MSVDRIDIDGRDPRRIRRVLQHVNRLLDEIDTTLDSHTHDAADIASGTLDDARVAASNVTQHEAAIDHNALSGYVADEHRRISAGAIGSRPAAGTAGRLYVSTDETPPRVYYDTGSTWSELTHRVPSGSEVDALTDLGASVASADRLLVVDDTDGTLKRCDVGDLPSGGGGGGTGLVQLGQTTVAGAAVTSVTVSGLDGDTEGIHLIHVLWKQASTIGSMSLDPNGLTTNQRQQNSRVSGGTQSAGTSTNLFVFSGVGSVAAGDWHEAWILVRAASGKPRQFFHFYFKQSSGTGSGGVGGWSMGTWDDTATNITSYDFVASVASSIDVDSIFTVYQLTHDSL